MMSDPRTPRRYYLNEEEYLNQKTSLDKLRSKLDDLVGALDSYKEKKKRISCCKENCR